MRILFAVRTFIFFLLVFPFSLSLEAKDDGPFLFKYLSIS